MNALIDELDTTVVLLGRLFSARHAEPCDGSGLSMPQMLTLRVLQEVGPSKVSDVATVLGIKAPATSTLIEALDKRGFIVRENDPDDRRVSILRVTDEGATALAESEARRREHLRRYLSVLSEDDLATLVRIHRTMIEAMVAERI
jgi:DNA-binding MarR family transcriptional regulator